MHMTSRDAIPSDEDFEYALKNNNLYRKHVLCRYLLISIENQGRNIISVCVASETNDAERFRICRTEEACDGSFSYEQSDGGFAVYAAADDSRSFAEILCDCRLCGGNVRRNSGRSFHQNRKRIAARAMQSLDWEEKKTMEFKGTLIVVKDCRKALKFYQDMFGFELIQDHDGNMELSGNLYLQEETYWERFTGRRVIPQSNQSELYFEEPKIDSFVKKLETLYPDTEYVNHLMTHSWGQRVVRFYNLDGNIIEVGTPV